ncbi:hypothetical protein [Paraburkholderia sp. GAS41]|uniref:hypothetical protein n=1 Tax=Paraburkholderia sp. GAS41 TaxID=3035134 RepID=UPI003D19F17A
MKTRRWVLGAVLTALCSLAYARAPQAPHGGGGGGGFAHAGAPHEMRGARPEGGARADRRGWGAHDAGGAHGGYNYAAQQRAIANGGYRGDSRVDPRNGFQYAGSITPVSTEARSVPRPPEDESMVRAGSIRADVARYNEERGAPRPVPRPPEQYIGRPPGPSPYRN